MRSQVVRVLTATIVAVCIWGCGGAQAPSPPAGPPTVLARSERVRGFMWRIAAPGESSGERAPSYLLGTMHMSVSLDDVLGSDHSELLTAREVWVEANTEDARDPAFMSRMLLPAGTDMATLLGAEAWNLAEQEFGGRSAVLRRFRPWVLVGVIPMLRLHDAFGASAVGEGLDEQVMREARAHNLPLNFLETLDQQVSLFENLGDEALLQALRAELADREQSIRNLRTLRAAYLAHDEETTSRLAFDTTGMSDADRFLEAFFYARNEAWLARLEDAIRQGGAFIAVGAGHTLGARGVKTLLERNGFVLVAM